MYGMKEMESASKLSNLWGGLKNIIAICFSGENHAKEIPPTSNSKSAVLQSESTSVSPKREARAWRAARTATPTLTDDILEQLNYAEWVDVQIRRRIVSVPKLWIRLYKEQHPKKLELELPERVDITSLQEAAYFLNNILSASQNHIPTRTLQTSPTSDMAKTQALVVPDDIFIPINRFIRGVSQEYSMPLPIQLLGSDKDSEPAFPNSEDPDRRAASARIRGFSAQIRQSYLSTAHAAYADKNIQSISDKSVFQTRRTSNGSSERASKQKSAGEQGEAQENHRSQTSKSSEREIPRRTGDESAIQLHLPSEGFLVPMPVTESVVQYGHSPSQQADEYPEAAAESTTSYSSSKSESPPPTVGDDSASPKAIYPKTPFRVNFFPANKEPKNDENDGRDTLSRYITSPNISPPPSPSPQRKASVAQSAHKIGSSVTSASPIMSSSPNVSTAITSGPTVFEPSTNIDIHINSSAESTESSSTHRRNNSDETNLTAGSSLLAGSYATPATTAAAESPAPASESLGTDAKESNTPKKRNIASRLLDNVQGKDVVHLNVNDSYALKIPDIHGTRAHELAALQSLSRVTAVAYQAPTTMTRKKGATKVSSPKYSPTPEGASQAADSTSSHLDKEDVNQAGDQAGATIDSTAKDLPTDANGSPSTLRRLSAAFRRISRANSLRSLRSSVRNSMRNSSRRASAIELRSSPENEAKRSSAPIHEGDESYSGPWWTRLAAASAPSDPLPPTPTAISTVDEAGNDEVTGLHTSVSRDIFTLPSLCLLRTPVKEFIDDMSLDGSAGTPGFARSTVASRNKAKAHKEIEISMTPASRPSSRATAPGPVPDSPSRVRTPALDTPIKIRTPVRAGQTMWPVGTPQLVRKYRQVPGNAAPPKSPTTIISAQSPTLNGKTTNYPFLWLPGTE